MCKCKLLLYFIMLTLISPLTACSANASEQTPTLAPGKWYDNYKLVAHALGAVDGVPYTNSLEAFQANYEKGIRVFEVDLIRGSDGILVARHDWFKSSYDNFEQEYPGYIAPSMDSNDFKITKINKKYTALTIKDIADIMREYPDIYIIPDTKDAQSDMFRFAYQMIIDELRGNPADVSRVIPQAYSYENYEILQQFGCFPDVILTLYQMPHEHEKIADFSVKNGIEVVVIYYGVFTPEVGEVYKRHGITVYLHTVNQTDDLIWHRSIGAEGFYTDFLNPVDYENINDFLGGI